MPDKEFRIGVNPAGGSYALITTDRPQTWKITQVSNDAPLASGLAYLRRNGTLVTPMIASNGVAGGEPPIVLYPADHATVEWAAVGVVGSVRVQYEVA